MQKRLWQEKGFCSGCRACVIACKDAHDSIVGVNFRRVSESVSGGFIKCGSGFINDVKVLYESESCHHCALCAAACPSGAIKKDAGFGAVYIKEEICTGCRRCESVCKIGALQFNAVKRKMEKCDMCRARLKEGLEPVCVAACPLKILHCE
jgi:anaerobic dimethyl sulfoxide reductase subunit B (iron-sulfur subunit)